MPLRRISAVHVALVVAVGCLAGTIGLRARERVDAVPASAAPQTDAPGTGKFTGPGSCAATACHGAVRPVSSGRILQTEYSTWIAQDRHARAADVLTGALAVRMARTLGLDRADTAPACLSCHALVVPEAARAATFASEGVSCEACHGPASGWLGPHTTRGWTHQQSVERGMHDTKDPVRRAERCLTCHLGTADKAVDHEMIAAGHPDLVFDLEAFSAAMPRHWRENTDSEPFRSVRSFAVGQLVHVRSSLERLSRRVGKAWPEYAELDCFACHHSLTRPENSWRQAQGYENRRPGNPPLNVARWATARHVLAAYDAAAAEELDGVMTKLAVEASRLRADAAQVTAVATRAREILDRGIARALAVQPDAALASRMLRAITANAETIAPRGERAAEQAAMALESLYATLPGGTTDTRTAIDELFDQFEHPSSYDPRKFVVAMKKIEGGLER